MHLKAVLPLHPPSIHACNKESTGHTRNSETTPIDPSGFFETQRGPSHATKTSLFSFELRMDWDDDAPPDLVGTETGVEAEEKPVKVPITIVTGAFPWD